MSESSDNRLIKDIPSDWEAIKLKRVVKIVTGNTPPKSQENNYAEEGVPWVKPDNLISDFVISNPKEKISEEGMKTARLIPEKSALVCCIGSVGKVSINTECCTTNQQINSIVFDQPDLLDNEFGLYVTLAAKEEYIKHSNKVVVSILNKTDQGSIKVPKPPLSKQKIIAKFLKHKTLSIDALISDKEKLIKLLEEKRQAIITEAVTKGLDPDVKMKDSGVEWIGEIPEHWEMKKIKHVVSIQNGREILKEVDEESTDYQKYRVYGSGGFFKWTNDYLYNGESVLFGRKGTLGKPLYVNGPFWTVDTMYYSKMKKVKAKYFYFILLSFPWEIITTQTALPSIVSTDLSNENWCFPSIKEQNAIINYLDKVDGETTSNVKLLKRQIELLKEYRQSLIYEAVTGKIDVQEMLKETEQEEVSSS
ncbi:MAG TPA: restriction endonuclease subunit S [Enterobacter roggenkampii]|nr:restriction endonuclease subunit S [Enterobacter roggenkampii]